MSLYAIIVVYNKSIKDSLSYSSLKDKDIITVVCDNSTRDMNNRTEIENDGNVYLNMNGNAGLSKAYNRALDYILSKEKNGYVLLMDDDTNFPESYFIELKKNIGKHDIYIPIVESDLGMISPFSIKNDVGKLLNHPIQEFNNYEHCAINSGLCINLKLFENYRYDEGLFLDYVDHKFFHDFRDKKVCILNTELYQSFSVTTDSKDKAIIRLKIFKKDSQYYYLNVLKKKSVYYYVVGKRKVRLCLQFKDLSILRF